MKTLTALTLMLLSICAMSGETTDRHRFTNVGYQETAGWKASSAPDARMVYGSESAAQFGDLRLPAGELPRDGYPVIVFVHGGAWRSDWTKNYTEALVEALSRQGFATWDLEFRRIGHAGGAYPGTFEDIADGADYLREITQTYPLNLKQVVAMGHSSGGHLALWLGGRHHLAPSSALYRDQPLALAGVVSIAGVNDLELAFTLGDRVDVLELLGVESPAAARGRFVETNPGRMLPLKVPQALIIGDQDSSWRLDMTERYQKSAQAAGDDVELMLVSGANHMDIVDARSGIADTLAQAARALLQPRGQARD